MEKACLVKLNNIDWLLNFKHREGSSPSRLPADLVVCVSQEPDEVMFLEAGGGEVRGDVGAGSQGGQALLQPHSLGVLRVGHCNKGRAFFNSSDPKVSRYNGKLL